MDEAARGVRVRAYKRGRYFEDEDFEASRSVFNPKFEGSKGPEYMALDCIIYHTDRFEALIDAKEFQNEDIDCMVKEREVSIKAVREDRHMHSLNLRYQLPKNIIAKAARCLLSSDGLLVVTAPWKDGETKKCGCSKAPSR